MIVLLLLVGVVVLFYPKERIVGGLRGGPIGLNETAYREEYRCLGVPYDFTPPWPDYGGKFLCYGLRYDKQCLIDSTGPSGGVIKVKTECK